MTTSEEVDAFLPSTRGRELIDVDEGGGDVDEGMVPISWGVKRVFREEAIIQQRLAIKSTKVLIQVTDCNSLSKDSSTHKHFPAVIIPSCEQCF